MEGFWTAILVLIVVQGTLVQGTPGYEGCYVDGFSVRLFSNEEKWDVQLTNARCVSHCRSKGYPYAGTEFTWQCFCGSEADYLTLPTAVSDSDCDTNCAGNSAEKCGGRLRLSVYAVLALDNEARLVGGGNDREGRLEVRAVNTKDWGTVCRNNFDTDDARVACKMLGFGDPEHVRDSSYFGQGSGVIKMANLGCGGHESSLFSCSYDGPGSHSCSHGDDVGLVCSQPSWASTGLGVGAIVGVVFGVIVFLTIVGLIMCVNASQGKSSGRVHTTAVMTAAPTVVHTSNTMYYSNAQYQQRLAYPTVAQQNVAYTMPAQQPVQAQSSQHPGQPATYQPPPTYDQVTKPTGDELYSQ